MDLQHDDYLGRLAFSEGEYERLELAFDAQVQQFAIFLGAAVEARLGGQARGEVGAHWASSIRQIAGALLDSMPDTEANLSEAQNQMRNELKAALEQEGWPDQLALKHESEVCSREISELILARWFELLREHLFNHGSIPLTPNVLPHGITLHQALENIDLANYGVDELTLSSGWREYWELQTSHFRENCEPIELGTDLFLTAELSGPVSGYRLFSTLDLARRHAEVQRGAKVATRQMVKFRFAEAVAHVAETLRSTVTRIGIPHSSKTSRLAFQEGWDRALQAADDNAVEYSGFLSVYEIGKKAAEIFGAQDDAPERVFVTMVGSGLDVVLSCGSTPETVSVEEFDLGKSLSGDALRQGLLAYAESRSMKVAEAADLYAASVAGSWACKVNTAGDLGIKSARRVFNPFRVFYWPSESPVLASSVSKAHEEAAAAAHFWSNGLPEAEYHENGELKSCWGQFHKCK